MRFKRRKSKEIIYKKNNDIILVSKCKFNYGKEKRYFLKESFV